ncbi:MAG: leucine-rich repeat protein [Bacteroidales bacterium]
MKTSLRLLNTLLLLSISSILFAQHVFLNKAIGIAKNHLSVVSGSKFKSAIVKNIRPQIFSVLSTVEKTDTLMFILNDTLNNNFTIVAADERVWPIIGYSLEGRYNEKNQPPAFVEWLENQKREIEYIKQNNIQPDSRVIQQWNKLSTPIFRSAEVLTEITPLLKTSWNQGCYFNAQCPSDGNGPCSHVQTGCVATSMAQIMKYWSYPTKGTGTKTYTHSTYGNLTADFGSTTYEWSQMPENITSQNDAIATLMFHCGVSVNMDYGPVTSSARDPIDAFINYFNYSSEAELVLKNSYSASEWADLLKSELDLKHPVWYKGNSSDEGHAWVCDGYQNSDYFHFNWGWGGSQDGYFYLDNMNYKTDQAAIIKIFPASLPDGFQGFFLSTNNLTIGGNGGTASLTISSSANWTVTSDQSWLSVSTGAGITGTSKIGLAAIENSTTGTRSATVTVSVTGFGNQVISVSQGTNVVVSPVITQPGLLHDVLGSQLASVTKLIITDSIDARDFKTMRDEMPLLSELDLSRAVIVEYSGTDGPGGYGSPFETYPANTLPLDAFFNNNTFLGKTSLTKVILPESITAIGPDAFEGCNGLISVSIPDSVITIDYDAFFDCNGMTSIYIPSSVTSIGNQAFSANSAMITVASDNAYYSSYDGVLFDKDKYKLINCPISKSGSYYIPSSVKSIENGAFEACNQLTSITIPTSVISIGDVAFYYCLGLSSITIPSSVTSIGVRAFWYNNALIYVDADNLFFSSYDGALFNKNKTKLIQCSFANSSFIIPSTVTEIGAHSFENCTKLISVTIPSSVNLIGDYAFWSTCNLSSVYIPSSVTLIGEFAFSSLGTFSGGIVNVALDNPNYSSVDGTLFDKTQTRLIMCPDFKTGTYTIPSTVNTIVNRAFLSCSALTSIIIPSSVTVIGYEAFSGCSGLQSIITRSKTPVILSSDFYTGAYNVFNGVNKSTCTLYVPYWTGALYSAAAQWKDFIHIQEVSDGFLPSKTSAFLSASEGSNTTIDLKSNVKWTASSDQPWLTVIPSSGSGDAILKFTAAANTSTSERTAKVTISAESVESEVIIITQSFKKAVIAGGLYDAFASNLNSLTCLEISGTIDARDFKTMRDEMPLLSHINISDATIVEYVGTEGTSLDGNTSYPANTIPDYAFLDANVKGKTSLTSIILPKSLISIGNQAFRLCTGLASIAIPSTVISIKDAAFNSCSNLNTVTIPSSVTSIGNFAFYGCTALSSIYAFPITPVDLTSSSTVFYDVNKSTCKLYVPLGSATLYSVANQWKDFTNIIEIPGFLLSSKILTISPEENSSASVQITSYTSWNVSSDQSWLTVNPSESDGFGTLTFTAKANPTGDNRVAIVTVSSSGVLPQTIIITQQGLTVGINVIPENSNHFICYPNPFAGEINIKIQNPTRIKVTAAIYNLFGQKIKDLVIDRNDEKMDLIWNGTNDTGQQVKPGIYICKMNNQSKRLIFKGK